MAELTDQEIVAACARAIGVQPHPMWNAAKWPTPEFLGTHGVFNPLTDRAQAMELGESDPVLFAKVVGVWASRGGKDNLLHMICHAFAGKQIEKEKNA